MPDSQKPSQKKPAPARPRSGSKPTLLSGGNPQIPKGGSKHPEVRYFDIHEDDELDEDRLRSWIEQASSLPGEEL